jgi:hypothetical protein
MSGFNFKEWSDLYETDPVAFEAKKDAILLELVEKAPARSKKALEHTLFRIRMSRQRSKTPLQSAIEASKLMWEAFGKLRSELDALVGATKAAALEAQGLKSPVELVQEKKTSSVIPLKVHTEAKVIPFKNLRNPSR